MFKRVTAYPLVLVAILGNTLKALGDSIIRTNNLLRFHFIFNLGIALWVSLSAGFPDEVLFIYLSTYFTYLLILLSICLAFVICSLFSLLFLKTYRFMFYVCIYLYVRFQYGFS